MRVFLLTTRKLSMMLVKYVRLNRFQCSGQTSGRVLANPVATRNYSNSRCAATTRLNLYSVKYPQAIGRIISVFFNLRTEQEETSLRQRSQPKTAQRFTTRTGARDNP